MKSIVNRFVLVGALTGILAGCEEKEPPPVFETIPVTRRDIVVSASAAGVIEPIRTVEVKSKASGEIMDVKVETGDAVHQGDLLVRVDPRVPRNALMQAEADLDVAEAQLANAQAQLKRSEALYKTQSITEQEYEDARLQAANANAALIRAQRALEDARIAYEDTDVKAPITGIVIQKNIEVGTVISSATREVGGGTVLLQMANLDTVQVRALVDETDIGKIQPGLRVTITVDAYPNRPFNGSVLKIEPQATVEQNVTMFPVLARIANTEGLLKPGMNAEVEVHVGNQQNVVAVPNAALRTERDLASAAGVLGLDLQAVNEQLAAARRQHDSTSRQASFKPGQDGTDGTPDDNTVTFRGRTIELPAGVSKESANKLLQKLGTPGAFRSLSEKERSLLRRIMGRNGGEGRQGRRRRSNSDFLFGGSYVVFALRNGTPTAVPVRTGLTDLDYSEVISGLSDSDTVIVLPSASLIESQQRFAERINRVRGGGLPGVQRRSNSNSSSSRRAN